MARILTFENGGYGPFSMLSMHSRKHKRVMRFAASGKPFTVAEACKATKMRARPMVRRLEWLVARGVLYSGTSFSLPDGRYILRAEPYIPTWKT